MGYGSKGFSKMSTLFSSKLEALNKGLFYAGWAGYSFQSLDALLSNPDIAVDETVVIMDMGSVLEDCTAIVFKNGEGIPVKIASCKFRDGYDLWLFRDRCDFWLTSSKGLARRC
jgi:hypothetical protein